MRFRSRVVMASAASVLTLVGVAACSTAPEGPSEASITIGVPSVSAFTSVIEEDGTAIFGSLDRQAVYEPLMYFDEATGENLPWLATSWTVGEDHLSLEFTLRDDVDFTDGTHFDAHAAEAFLDALVAGSSGASGYYQGLGAEFTATGDYTLKVTTTTPIPAIGLYAVNFNVMGFPSTSMLDSAADSSEEPVGTGPYLIEEYVPEVSVSLVRNPDYWNPEAYPYDRVTLRAFSDNVAALNALKSGQIDATQTDISLAASAEADGLVIHRGAGQFLTLMVYDHTGDINPAFGDVRVRRAMNLAFDREAIAENIDQGFGAISSQPFTTGQAEYIEGGDERYGYDLDEARRLMAEAGYADGFDLVIPANAASTGTFEPIVQQALGDIGIRVTFEQFADGTAYYVAGFSGKYPVTMYSWYYVNTFSVLKDPKNPALNGAAFAPHPLLVSELVTAIEFGSDEESTRASQELGEYVLSQALFVPFSKPATLWASTSTVTVQVGGIVGPVYLRGFDIAR